MLDKEAHHSAQLVDVARGNAALDRSELVVCRPPAVLVEFVAEEVALRRTEESLRWLKGHVTFRGHFDVVNKRIGKAVPVDHNTPVVGGEVIGEPGKVVCDVNRVRLRLVRQIFLTEATDIALSDDAGVHEAELKTSGAKQADGCPDGANLARCVVQRPPVVLLVPVGVPVSVAPCSALDLVGNVWRVSDQSLALVVHALVVSADPDAKVI